MKRPKYKVNDNVVYTEEYKKTAMLPWSNSKYVISKVNRKFIFKPTYNLVYVDDNLNTINVGAVPEYAIKLA